MEKCSIFPYGKTLGFAIIMGNPWDFPYANPKGWHYTSRERAEGEWTCDHEKKKEIATYNGCPFGAPICTPLWGVH